MLIVLRGGGEVVGWEIGYDPEFLRARPNNALFDRLIEDEIAAGSARIDFGASPGGARSRVDRFKESFGAAGATRRVVYREAIAYRLLRAVNRRLRR